MRQTRRVSPMAPLCLIALTAALVLAAASQAASKKRAVFTIKFKPGTITMINEDEVKKAAMYAVEKGYMLQIEGYSCHEDGEVDGKPTFRLEQGDKRAEAVRVMMLKMGVPHSNVYTISYDIGGCQALITVLK